MENQDNRKAIDKRYYLTNSALQKIFAHPDFEISQTSLTVLQELKKSRQRYFEELVKDKEKEVPVIPVLSLKPDLSLKPEELQALDESLNDFWSKLEDKDQVNIHNVIKEQKEIILNRPPTFLDRLKAFDKKRIKRASIVAGMSLAVFGPGTSCTIGLINNDPYSYAYAGLGYCGEMSVLIMGMLGYGGKKLIKATNRYIKTGKFIYE